ncbi:uncharacterized protein LOC126372043 isoform X4 [Pectinophora gossypiella]|uniref:uncharacterized protein LOC126372043 isoform X4 n=1 Tax=Pectinophora gossypiella TaxID=13191 RepID=UPI00214EDFCC|nr:uncharacterized protein LOC126372043 isoform X4 [Pectinophora gossypiella]
MQTHGNLTASYLWQPGEFARRMLGERPSPVPPTRELWPPPQHQLSISTLQVAYHQDDSYSRRAATLPPQPYVPTTVPIEREHGRPRVCTVGTNTDPPQTLLSKLRNLFKKQDEDVPIGHPPPGRLTAVPRETALDTKEEENKARRALNGIKKAISGAKYRIAPGTETVDSPKIVYDAPKPGDRMTTTFGAREPRKWCRLPSKESCEKKLRGVGSWCAEQRPRRPPRREPHAPCLQITQVIALICGLLVVILMVLGLASADWLMAAGWRQGLFMHCIDPDAPTPLPFDITAQPGCYAARPAPYIKAAAGLCVATLAADVCGALLTGLGLRAADHRTKFRYYRFAVLAMALALMCILIALVIYPVCFAAELNLGNRSVWEFGWAYGVGWGAAIFLFGAVVLLLCDKESEELYYKERKLSRQVVSAEASGRP